MLHQIFTGLTLGIGFAIGSKLIDFVAETVSSFVYITEQISNQGKGE